MRGINWGVPWPKGDLLPERVDTLGWSSDVPVQNKIMAYWPDGSVKWTGHAAVLGPSIQLPATLTAASPLVSAPIAESKYDGVYIDNGVLTGYFPRHGETGKLAAWFKIAGVVQLRNLRLRVKTIQGIGLASLREVMIEDDGPVKAVVKLTAQYSEYGRPILDYVLRFRIYRGSQQIELIHTLIVRQVNEPILGLGLTFDTRLQGDPWNRQVKFAGDDGIYTEPAQLLISRRYRANNQLYAQQAAGSIVTPGDDVPDLLAQAQANAVWNNFYLDQREADHYDLVKQTDTQHLLLKIGSGKRAKGTIYAGGTNGGVAISAENFWQKVPGKLAIEGLTETHTQNTLWLWSDTAQPMDFRHYSDREHTNAYEGMKEIRATAEGIGNTTRIWLNLFDQPASNEELWSLALENESPSQVVLTPADYYQTRVFGTYSLPDTSTPAKAALENQLLALRNFYLKEVDAQGWYGYWHYGDVMHSYDAYRHVWFYDFGGYAWQNTELMVNIWLWQDFLRTGDAAAFYFAAAMTRHTSEVDQYHAGEYQGLGSRHNVEHWGDSCKEVRISEAGLNRYYYYLTADERIGEVMNAVKDVEDYAFDELAPLRIYYDDAACHNPFLIRTGPDWAALTSNWYTQWERTGDTEYLNRIKTGFDCIKSWPMRLLMGPVVAFDKHTKRLHTTEVGNSNGYHMIISFGAPQFWLEYAEVLQDNQLQAMIAEFGRFYAYSDAEKRAHSNGQISDAKMAWPMFATGLMTYAAKYDANPRLAEHAWQLLYDEMPADIAQDARPITNWQKNSELPWVTTNAAAQWALNVMMALELAPQQAETVKKSSGG